MWEFNGLPLHPLVVHAAVVLGPLAALAALAYVALPRYRDWLRWVALVSVLLATAAIWAAYLTGNNFFSHGNFDQFSKEIQDRIHTHQSYARTLRWITTGFAAVTVLATRRRHRHRTSGGPIWPDRSGARRRNAGARRRGAAAGLALEAAMRAADCRRPLRPKAALC